MSDAIIRETLLNMSNCNNNECKATANLKLCSKCKNVRYCSVDCQRIDWINHKQQCKSPNDIAATLVTNCEDIYNVIPDYVIKMIRDSISEEDRFTKAFIYSDMSEDLEYAISQDEHKKEWNNLISNSCISEMKNQPLCKRILVNKIDFIGNFIALVCTCVGKQCSKNIVIN